MAKGRIYTRFSSDKQSVASTEAQIRACREYAAAHDITITGVYSDEAVSGKGQKTASRKQYQKMLHDAEKGGFETILIHKYDRVARNVGEHVNLEMKLQQWGIQLIAVAQDFGASKEAKIMRTLTWAMSEYYIDNLSSEVKKGHKENALKGLHNGGCAPFGYDVINKKYVVNELEAAYVRKIFNAALNREGFTEIIQEMERADIRGKRGKSIKYTQIYEMLRNEKYTGAYLYSMEMESSRDDRRNKPNAIKIENALPAIIDKAQFIEVQKIMKERKQTGKKAGYLCSGVVYCHCGAKMHGIRSAKGEHEYYYYYCSGKCGAPRIRMEKVDKAALEYLRDLLSDENQRQIAEVMRQYQAGEGSRMDEFQSALKHRIEEKRGQYDALMKNLSAGALPREVVADIGKQMQEIKEEIAVLETAEPPKDYTVDEIRSWLSAIKAAPDDRAVHLLIERIQINAKKDGFDIQSTLKTVLGETGRGDTQHILPET